MREESSYLSFVCRELSKTILFFAKDLLSYSIIQLVISVKNSKYRYTACFIKDRYHRIYHYVYLSKSLKKYSSSKIILYRSSPLLFFSNCETPIENVAKGRRHRREIGIGRTRIARLASEVGAAKLVRYSPRYGDALKGISMQKVAAARIFGPVVLARINFCPIHIVLASCTNGTRFLRECREAFTCPLLPAYIYIYIYLLCLRRQP